MKKEKTIAEQIAKIEADMLSTDAEIYNLEQRISHLRGIQQTRQELINAYGAVDHKFEKLTTLSA